MSFLKNLLFRKGKDNDRSFEYTRRNQRPHREDAYIESPALTTPDHRTNNEQIQCPVCLKEFEGGVQRDIHILQGTPLSFLFVLLDTPQRYQRQNPETDRKSVV